MDQCPLCSRRDKHWQKALPLYGTPVCRKCVYHYTRLRQGAYILDGILYSLCVYQLEKVVISLGVDLWAHLLMGLVWAVSLNAIFYMKDGFAGQGPGKRILGLRSVHASDGQPIGFLTSFKRNAPLFGMTTLLQLNGLLLRIDPKIYLPLLWITPLASLILYSIIAWQTHKGPRWGDGFAGTKVIWTRHEHHPLFATGSSSDG